MMSRKRADVAFGCNKKEYDASTDAKAIQELARPTPSLINVNWFFFDTKIDLFHIRYILLVVNLVVLGAAVETTKGWFLMEDIKRELSSTDAFHINRWLHEGIGAIETITMARIDDFFIYTSICLGSYWLVFGARGSLKYGAEEDSYALLLAFPAILVLAVLEIKLALVILNIDSALTELDCDQLRSVLSYNNLSMIVDLRNFMMAEGVRIAALFITSAFVQVATGALLFRISDLPFQRRFYMDDFLFNDLKRVDNIEINNNNEKDTTDELDKSHVIYPCAAKSLMVRLCRPDVREFHRRRQIVDKNPHLFSQSEYLDKYQ